MAQTQRRRPTGVTVLGILYILFGIGALIGSAAAGIIAGSLSGSEFLGSAAVAIGGLIVFILIIIAVIDFVIAGALLSGKSWGRTIAIIFAIIDLMLELITLVSGNVFAIIGIVLDIIVLYYMWRPHVIEYFKGQPTSNLAASSQQAAQTEVIREGACPNCGNQLPTYSHYCNKCGSKLKSCSKCSTLNVNEATICSKCSSSF